MKIKDRDCDFKTCEERDWKNEFVWGGKYCGKTATKINWEK